MNALTVRKAIYGHFLQLARQKGFESTNNDFPLSRRTESGSQSILIAVTDRDLCCEFEIMVGLRFDAVDDIVNDVTSVLPAYRHKSHSVVIGTEYFSGVREEFKVTSNEEIREAMAQIENIFRKDFFPLMDCHRSLEQGERLINENPDSKFRVTTEHLAAAAVVSAAICKRTEYERIVEYYRKRLRAYIEPIRIEFESVVTEASKLR